MNEAIKLFFEKFPEYKEKKYKIRTLHNGFTNDSYFIKFKDEAFQIRIGKNNKIVNRNNEQAVIKSLDIKEILYFNEENGNMIKKWIQGRTPRVFNSKFLKMLIDNINAIHFKKPNENILKHDYFCFIECSKKYISNRFLKLYYDLVDECVNYDDFVLSHNDLNCHNMVLSKDKKLIFIDYEWSRMNDRYWDLSNFLRETNFSLKKIKKICKTFESLNYEKLIKFIYICICFSVQWTFCTQVSNAIVKYRNKTYKLLIKFYEYIIERKYA